VNQATPLADQRHPLDPEVLARVQGLALRASRVAEGVLAGLHRSARQGESVDFAEHKPYSPGDDLRHLDWRVLGRSDRLIVKRYETETNLRAMLAVDFSASMTYRSASLSKVDYGAILAATLASLLLRQGDAVGLHLLQARPLVLPPVGSPEHLKNIVELLQHRQAAGPTRLVAAAESTLAHTGQHGLLVLISDLLEPEENWLAALRMLAARGVEVMVLQVLDRDEVDFPFEDPAIFESLEDDRRLAVYPQGLRQAYRREFGNWLLSLRRQLAVPGASYQLAVTDTPPHRPLIQALHQARLGLRQRG